MKLSNKSLRTTKLLTVFGGFLGLHYFYLGNLAKDILYFFTLGLFLIGWFKDIYKVYKGNVLDRQGHLVIEGFPTEFQVAGTHYQQQNVIQLARTLPPKKQSDEYIKKANPEGGRAFYETPLVWASEGLEFIPEPKNSQDRNAIRVEIKGLFVGYVPAELAPKFRQYMDESWEWEIYGGAFKSYSPLLDEVMQSNTKYESEGSNKHGSVSSSYICSIFLR